MGNFPLKHSICSIIYRRCCVLFFSTAFKLRLSIGNNFLHTSTPKVSQSSRSICAHPHTNSQKTQPSSEQSHRNALKSVLNRSNKCRLWKNHNQINSICVIDQFVSFLNTFFNFLFLRWTLINPILLAHCVQGISKEKKTWGIIWHACIAI